MPHPGCIGCERGVSEPGQGAQRFFSGPWHSHTHTRGPALERREHPFRCDYPYPVTVTNADRTTACALAREVCTRSIRHTSAEADGLADSLHQERQDALLPGDDFHLTRHPQLDPAAVLAPADLRPRHRDLDGVNRRLLTL